MWNVYRKQCKTSIQAWKFELRTQNGVQEKEVTANSVFSCLPSTNSIILYSDRRYFRINIPDFFIQKSKGQVETSNFIGQNKIRELFLIFEDLYFIY